MVRRFVYVEGHGVVEVNPDYKPRQRVHIISDHHTPFMSHASGNYFDSKSAYRRELKELGYAEVACSAESRIAAENERAKPKAEVPRDLINHVVDSAGVDWRKGIAP